MNTETDMLRQEAIAILRQNDRGSYTVPTHGLYPFQWNWDSALTALGQRHVDEARAWTEIETLMAHQWPCGMVPHIIFHAPDAGYFPGPEIWRTPRPVPTSGITQPAVAGLAVARMHAEAKDRAMADARARALLPAISKWHRWFYAARDPQGEGLVAIIHPWESGRDNSADWDAALSRVPTEGITPYKRRDLDHADAKHRPTQAQYDRYVWLLEHFRSRGWDSMSLHDASPFRVVDPGFNGILLRSCSELAQLAERLGEKEIAAENRRLAERGLAAMEKLWSSAHGQYLCFDRASESLIDNPSVGGLLAAVADVPGKRARAIAETIAGHNTKFRVASQPPGDARFDGKRYWRGPCWLVVNWLISDGLARAGEMQAAQAIIASSLEMIREGSFAEYFDPLTGEPCGGKRFTWTAAMVLEFLNLHSP